MSAKISGKVWELDLDPVEKLVLLALADHADHDGHNVRPGNQTLIEKTGLTERTVGQKIRGLVEKEILIEVSIGTGRGKIREYSISIDHVKRRPYFVNREAVKAEGGSTFTGSQRSRMVRPLTAAKVEDNSTFEAQKVESHDTKGRISRHERSNLTTRKVESHDSAYKEGTVMNRHENRHEPAEGTAAAGNVVESDLVDPALAAIEAMFGLILSQYSVNGSVTRLFEARITEETGKLNGMGCTPESLDAFLRQRSKLPSLNYLATDWQTWAVNERRSVSAQPARSASPRSDARRQAAAEAREKIFGKGGQR